MLDVDTAKDCEIVAHATVTVTVTLTVTFDVNLSLSQLEEGRKAGDGRGKGGEERRATALYVRNTVVIDVFSFFLHEHATLPAATSPQYASCSGSTRTPGNCATI